MTEESLRLTAKYSDEYFGYCRERECGEGCPVFDEHARNPKESCFMTYCRMRESGRIPPPAN
jgi:hypothetical protein